MTGLHRNRPQTYLVSRHAGALEWVRQQGIVFDAHCPHLDTREVGPGDTVIGTLPINRVAEICERGGHYLHLALDLPAEARGCELTASELDRYGAKLVAYHVSRVAN